MVINNLYGPYRVTKAFAPLIIESKGRISTISSISGILSGRLFGPYSMSKHAIEAFSDSLSIEMQKFDVKVSVVEPGNFKSKIGNRIQRKMKERAEKGEKSLYEEEYQNIMKYFEARQTAADPIAVAKAVEHAMFSENPKMRYMVTPNQKETDMTLRKNIQELVELNQSHEFSRSREELIKMLVNALAGLEK